MMLAENGDWPAKIEGGGTSDSFNQELSLASPIWWHPDRIFFYCWITIGLTANRKQINS
jgi:hypothetical protein